MLECRLVREQREKHRRVPMGFSHAGHGNDVAKNDVFLFLFFLRRSRSFPVISLGQAVFYKENFILVFGPDTDLLCFPQKLLAWVTGPHSISLHFYPASTSAPPSPSWALDPSITDSIIHYPLWVLSRIHLILKCSLLSIEMQNAQGIWLKSSWLHT